MNPRFELFVASEGLQLNAGINGAPLARVSDPRPQQTRLPVDWWLLPDENHLTASVAPTGSGPYELELSVCRVEERASPIASVRWTARAGAEMEPFVLSLPFVAAAHEHAHPGRYDTFEELDPVSWEALRGSVRRLVEAFARRDAAAVVGMLEARFQDFCAAFDDDLAEHRAAVLGDFGEMLADPSTMLAAVDLEALRVTPCAHGRVFHVGREDGGELIDIRTPDGGSSMQVYVAALDAQWMVVR
jgi:hypothetical protein